MGSEPRIGRLGFAARYRPLGRRRRRRPRRRIARPRARVRQLAGRTQRGGGGVATKSCAPARAHRGASRQHTASEATPMVPSEPAEERPSTSRSVSRVSEGGTEFWRIWMRTRMWGGIAFKRVQSFGGCGARTAESTRTRMEPIRGLCPATSKPWRLYLSSSAARPARRRRVVGWRGGRTTTGGEHGLGPGVTKSKRGGRHLDHPLLPSRSGTKASPRRGVPQLEAAARLRRRARWTTLSNVVTCCATHICAESPTPTT
jgi:hypothetical protein